MPKASTAISPKGFKQQGTFESDGNSTHGAASAFGSVIGHDDPTAVMANIIRSDASAVQSLGSLLTTDHTRDDNTTSPDSVLDTVFEDSQTTANPKQLQMASSKNEKDLREQLSELDRTEEQWQAKMLQTSSLSSTDSREGTATIYVNEAGANQASPGQRFVLAGSTIKKKEVKKEVPVPDSSSPGFPEPTKPVSPSSQQSASSFPSGIEGFSSTDQSMTSSTSGDVKLRHHEADLEDPAEEEKKSETDVIVQQVQKRLIASNDNIEENLPSPIKERMSPSSQKGQGTWNAWLPVGDEATREVPQGRGLAAKSDLSIDEDMEEEDEKHPRRKRCFVMLILLALLLVAVAILVYFLVLKDNNDDKSVSNVTEGNPLPAGTAPTPAPNSGTDPSPSATESPDASPTVLSPDLSPVAPPIPSPDMSPAPVATGTTTLSPTDSRPVDGTTAAPSPAALAGLKARLYPISGSLLDDETTPQFAALDWLEREDPANLDFETVTDRDLYQRYIGALLYFSTDGDEWEDDFGFLQETSVCSWQNSRGDGGIICSDEGSIHEIVLDGNNLVGPLPFEIQELSELKVLQLRANGIVGTLPEGFGELSVLEELDLRQNEMFGTVPTAIFQLENLRKLFLLRNSQLSGTIPTEIGLAKNLEMISFQRCSISGSLPDTLGDLDKLYLLTMMDNDLEGTIPSGLTKLPLLEVLELSNNMFTGSIPEFENQPELYFLSLSGNQLGGTIPSSFGTLLKLLFLDIGENLLSGSIPTEVSDLPELVTFYVSNNQLTGSLPTFSGNLNMLQAISVDKNLFSGPIVNFFSEDGPHGRLQSVDLGSNYFDGPIPTFIGNFTALTDLVLKDNNLSGPIPVECVQLTNLDTLSFNGNHLNGTIPEEFGELDKLVFLDLGSNNLSGSIPDAISALDLLAVLNLASNELVGPVPIVLGVLQELVSLQLQHNLITGDLDAVFCPDANANINTNSSRTPILTFISDCAQPNQEVICTCCTECCNASSVCVDN